MSASDPSESGVTPNVRDLLAGVRQRFFEPPQLQRREIASRHAFGIAVEHERLRLVRHGVPRVRSVARIERLAKSGTACPCGNAGPGFC
jgi:hypothetical protein